MQAADKDRLRLVSARGGRKKRKSRKNRRKKRRQSRRRGGAGGLGDGDNRKIEEYLADERAAGRDHNFVEQDPSVLDDAARIDAGGEDGLGLLAGAAARINAEREAPPPRQANRASLSGLELLAGAASRSVPTVEELRRRFDRVVQPIPAAEEVGHGVSGELPVANVVSIPPLADVVVASPLEGGGRGGRRKTRRKKRHKKRKSRKKRRKKRRKTMRKKRRKTRRRR